MRAPGRGSGQVAEALWSLPGAHHLVTAEEGGADPPGHQCLNHEDALAHQFVVAITRIYLPALKKRNRWCLRIDMAVIAIPMSVHDAVIIATLGPPYLAREVGAVTGRVCSGSRHIPEVTIHAPPTHAGLD